MRILPVVLCGGAGTRFWPASRQALPKPFVPLVGRRTLLDETLARVSALAPGAPCRVVSGQHLARLTRRAVGARRNVRLLLEPVARNTAAAVAWAAADILGRGESGLMAVFPADHHIPDRARFGRTLRAAARAAADGEHLVLVGIQPSHPDTAYGYLRVVASENSGVLRVRRFVEKPALARARRYLRAGGYLWNAGMVVASPARVLSETRSHAPEVWRAFGSLLEALAAGRRVGRARLAAAYRRIRPISFDHGVLERSRRVRAVRGRFRWSDLGSWDALAPHLQALPQGNRVRGRPPVALLDASDNIVWNASDKDVVLLGVHGLAIIQTKDALLVCPKERAQEVRRIVEELVRRGRRDLV